MAERRIDTLLFEDDGKIPNNPTLPLLIYTQVLDGRTGEAKSIFDQNDWKNSWVGGVFGYHHYHSNTHEVLGVISGEALLQFGGEAGKQVKVTAGDTVVIPAGVGHKKIQSSNDFKVIGAYPGGSGFDLKTGKAEEREEAIQNIKEVPLPKADPLFGDDTIFTHWKED
ncbi:cupin domain-containing protein [Bacillus gobiensis]|uniref:cupin domain-containing protein n=1 Tax=Bacillus gobiensis TaxID=1441095 RepID=UPI003D25EB2E